MSGVRHMAPLALAVWGLLSASGDARGQVDSGPWQDDFLAAGVLGAWEGDGVVYGNPVTLERTWSLELAGQFLHVDMGVRMTNGLTFRALVYWTATGAHRYEAVWLDELGRTRRSEATGDPDQEVVTSYCLEDTPGDGPDEAPGWMRMTIRITGPSTYVETLHRETPDGWEEVGRFSFRRRGTSGTDQPHPPASEPISACDP